MMSGSYAKRESMKWQPIRTMPLGYSVMVKTVKGIECMAKPRNRSTRWIRRSDAWGPARINCSRLNENGHVIGDVVAVAWKKPSTPAGGNYD